MESSGNCNLSKEFVMGDASHAFVHLHAMLVTEKQLPISGPSNIPLLTASMFRILRQCRWSPSAPCHNKPSHNKPSHTSWGYDLLSRQANFCFLDTSCTFVHHTDLTSERRRWPLQGELSLATARHHLVASPLSFPRSYCPVSPENSRIIFYKVPHSKASSFMAPVHPLGGRESNFLKCFCSSMA
ncbi:hypothetical protein WN944_012779 [Citrus x changshan-huyou]|uniref:Uncharacterized protein n=1 Tax=Citrus x changshan-huyou TaxID=2935761 RepID=A0AAP0M2Q5_9ROSI